MRILHVAASLAPRYGGPSKVCLELCRELARRGVEVAIYTTNLDGDLELDVPLGRPILNSGVKLFYFRTQLARSYSFSIPLARALAGAICSYDIVHIQSIWAFPTLIAAAYSRRYGVPYLIRPHGSLDPYVLIRRRRLQKWAYARLIERRNLDRAAAIHFTSEEERRLAEPLGLRAPAVVVPNGLDLSEYGPLPRREDENCAHKTIVFLGRLVPKKGLDLLARAFGRLLRRMPTARLVIAGPDDSGYGEQVRRWLAEEGALARTTFAGMLSGADKLSALRGADAFVLPSYDENFGMAVVEAMACGLPVVISNRVAIWREVAEAGAGLVVDCEAGQLAGALEQLLDSPSRCEEMGRRGRALVEARFGWETVGDRMMSVYRSIIESERSDERGARDPGCTTAENGFPGHV